MARSLNIVIGADIEKLKKGFDDAIAVIQKSGNQMSADVAKSAKDIQDKLSNIATKNPTAGTVRQLTNLAMEARALGPEFAQAANDIIKQAGRIKDSIGDARAEVSYFASDTRRLDAVLGGIQGVAGAFGAVEGATAILGFESKDLQQTMMKLQGAIALVNGVQAVQNALQAESAVMVGLQTAATRIQTYVMGQATVAARVYAAALVATGAGAIIVAIGLVASAFSNVGKKAEEAGKKVETLTDKYNKDAAAAKETSEMSQEISDERLKKELNNAKLKGASDAQLAQIEINFLKQRKANLTDWLQAYDKNSAKYLQLKRDISSIEATIDEKQTQLQIDQANKRRNKKKELLQKELDDALQAIRDRAAGEAAAQDWLINNNKKAVEKKKQELQKSKELSGSNLIAGTATAPILMQVKIDPKSYSQVAQDFQTLIEGITSAVEQLGEDVSSAFAEAIGGALSGQQDVLKNLGGSIISALASFMSKVGKMLIAYAISIEKLKTAFASPAEALAAGVALVAIGTAVTATMSKGPKVPAFAEGGIVSGPTLGLMGEYPGASTNPEVIAPLDKLRNLIKTDNQSGFVASTTISGRDLAIVLNRYNTDSKRG